MKKTINRFVSVCMALLMLASLIPTTAFAAQPDTNPHFTVQYHAWVVDYATQGNYAFDVINTDKPGEGNGGNLPTNANAGSLPTKTIYFDSTNGGEIQTTKELSQVFKDRTDFSYYSAPGLHYIDQVTHANSNYELSEIWVKDKASDAKWTVYTTASKASVPAEAGTVFKSIADLSTVKFSNDSSLSHTATRLVLREGTVIRLVYNTASGNASFSAKVFDYDISTGLSASNPLDTNLEGINSHNTILAFGNANTNSGLADNTMSDDKYVNRANFVYIKQNGTLKKAYFPVQVQACYGITRSTGLTSAGLPIFNVSAPDLFSNTAITGKTILPGNHTLGFANTGDLYVIDSATIADPDGTPAVSTKLGQLTRMDIVSGKDSYSSLWSNNFFPLDGLSQVPGVDPMFGTSDVYFTQPDGSPKKMPDSDDCTYDHNCFFGMTYDVDFTLDADYVGPMNYLFFGDDDLWLYLIKNGDEANAQLVCDIGGVHSSVGEYVDLWDYIKGGKNNHDTAEYTLRFFYTERGASGSTFYMSFVLPQVHPIVPIEERGDLKVTKTVTGITTDESFDFQIKLSDNSKLVNEVYSAAVYETASSQPVYYIFNGSDTLNVTLKDGGYVTISNLPAGATYTVTETPNDIYATTATGATGTIVANTTKTAAFTNRFKTGNLTVSKTVTDGGDTAKAFPFTVTLDDTSINGTYGGMSFTNGVANFSLAHGQSATAANLPAGINYTVTEADDRYYISAATGATGTIADQATATAAFTNRFYAGSLTVSKTVTGDRGDTTKQFSFSVTLSDTSINGTFGDMTFTNGVANLSLAHGQSATATNLPVGVTYTVTEAEVEPYVPTSTGATGTIADHQTASAAFTNRFYAGDLTVTKTVTGEKGDTAKAFPFTVTLADTSINGTYGDMTFTDGVASFSLAHGQSATAVNLPVGVSYTVTETEDDAYTTTSIGAEGTIADHQILTAAFTNDYKEGSLTVSKTVTGDEADTTKAFPFTVALSDTSISGAFGGMTFTDGVASFSLAHGQSVTATGLPAGITYTVTETDCGDYFPSVNGQSGDTATGAIVNDATAAAAFSNHLASDAVVDLSVLKTLDGQEPGERVFTFYLINSDNEILQTKQNDEAGVVTFDTLTYDTVDTYYYAIFEQTTDDPAMDYDASVYYIVVDVTLGDNYEAQVTVVKNDEVYEGQMLFANETVELTELTVTKDWQGDGDDHRPDSVMVQLYCNGEAVGEAVALSQENQWTYTWIELRAEGNEWTVDEVDVPENYRKTVSYNEELGQWVITNKYVPDTSDHAPLALWTGAMLLSLAGICVMLLLRRKRT